jgi:hypothetical protein
VRRFFLAVAFLACGESLTIKNDPSTTPDGGVVVSPDDGGSGLPDGALPNPDSGAFVETCKRDHKAPFGFEDPTFTSVGLQPKGPPAGGAHRAFALTVLSDGRIAVAGENSLRCGGGSGPQTFLTIVQPNGDSPATVANSTCPTSVQTGTDFFRGITSAPGAGRYFLLGRQGTSGASANGFTETNGQLSFQAQMSDVRVSLGPFEWTAYGAVADADGRGIVVVGGDNPDFPVKGYVERFVLENGVMGKREDSFKNITTDVRGFRAIAAASFGYVVAGSTNASQTLVIKLDRAGNRILFGPAQELVDPEVGRVVAVAADGNDVLVLLTSAVDSRLLKLKADGVRDLTFGSEGITELPNFTIDEPIARGALLLRQCDGKWLVGGKKDSNPTVARFDAVGVLDRGFGANGYATMRPGPAGTNYTLTGMAIDNQERLLLLSTSTNSSVHILHRLSL